jgi:hypothetical protein
VRLFKWPIITGESRISEANNAPYVDLFKLKTGTTTTIVGSELLDLLRLEMQYMSQPLITETAQQPKKRKYWALRLLRNTAKCIV